MASTSISIRRLRKETALARAAKVIGNALNRLARWQAVRLEREHLASFDDRMLQDIGLTRADVEREYRKPFWRD